MKLKSVVMTGFRSIKSTERITIEDRTTVLIGANDHGKSNILEAIRALNEDRPLTSEDRNWDFPADQSVRIEWHFTITSEKTLHDEIQKLKPALIDDTEEEKDEESLDVNTLPEETKIELKRIASLEVAALTTEEVAFLNARRLYLTQEEKEKFDSVLEEETDSEVEEDTPPSFIPKSDEHEIVFYRDDKENKVRVLSVPEENILVEDENYILNMRPRIELFEAYGNNLKDKVKKVDLEKDEYEFMQGIFRLAGIWEERENIFTADLRTSRLLKEASDRLTKALNQDWNQGRDLQWLLQHTTGGNIEIMIQDPAISTRYTRPSYRSSGFKTYFVTSMVVKARTANNPNHSYLYLFDEPGIYLHPQAQLDLQRTYEIIADEAQIIYTTHSLFLVNKNYPERNKVISKTLDGTKVDLKPYRNNWKSVRESLGILLSNNFLIADKSLILEGPSDCFYLLGAIRKLKALDKIDIDLNDLSIVDGGNSQNYVAMTKLMLSEGREIMALVDGDGGGDKIKKDLDIVCEEEIKAKKLTVIPLEKSKSIEDYCVEIPLLKEAIKVVANDLIAYGVRTLKKEIQLDDELKKIVNKTDQTLGKTVDDVTKSLFEDNESISKLSIALKYEELSGGDSKPSAELIKLISNIKKGLSLKGEKSAENGVFEEIV